MLGLSWAKLSTSWDGTFLKRCLKKKNYRNGGIWKSGISKSLAECQVLCVLRQCTLHDNVVFSVCARMDNAMYIMFIMWNFISGLDAWYHIQFNISCGVAVMGRSNQNKIQVSF